MSEMEKWDGSFVQLRVAVEKEINGGDPAVPGNDENHSQRKLAPPQGGPISRVRSGAVDCLEQCAKQLRRLLDHIRGNGLETVHQQAVAVKVVVEDPPQVLSGRQPPVPLQLGRNRIPS